MDEFDHLISLENEAKILGEKEALEYFRKNDMIKKAKKNGFLFGNEINYYNTYLKSIKKNKEIFINSNKGLEKMINKRIDKVFKLIENLETSKKFLDLNQLRMEFKTIIKLCKIEIVGNVDKKELF